MRVRPACRAELAQLLDPTARLMTFEPEIIRGAIASRTGACRQSSRTSPQTRSTPAGNVMPAERKSVEPMAAPTAPARVAAQHQSLLHFVGQGKWSDEKVTEPEAPTLRPERHVAAVVKSRRGS